MVTTRKSTQAINNQKKIIGSKAEVYHGTAHHTSGGLTKKDLVKTKWGRIVSRKKQLLGKNLAKQFPPQLTKAAPFR